MNFFEFKIEYILTDISNRLDIHRTGYVNMDYELFLQS